MARACYERYIENIQISINSDSKQFWNYVNSKSKNSELPHLMSYNSETSDDGTVISDYFSDHFSSVYNSNVTCHTYDFNVSNSVVIERCDVEETDIYIMLFLD